MHNSTSQTYTGIFNDSFPPILDGVTLTVMNYVHWLPQSGMRPCVVTPWNPRRAECGCEVMRYFSLPIPSRRPYRYGYPKADPFIWKRLDNTHFNLVHSHCPFSSGRLAVYVKKKQNVPLIGTFHSKYRSDLEHSLRRTPWFVPIIMRRIIGFFNACDEVWIPQAAVQETVREYGYKGPLTVVDNGIDFADIDPESLKETKSEARKRAGISPSALSLLFVGQHIWEKGIGIIVETLAKISGKVDFTMDFIGTGYAIDDLKAMVARLGLSGQVRIHGCVEERGRLKDFYSAADIFLFPSLYDNAPLVVREAAAMGTPSVIPEGSTASEVITDGVNGFLTQHSAEAYARTIESLAKNREEIIRTGIAAKQTIVRSWQDVVEEVADRYRVILKRRT